MPRYYFHLRDGQDVLLDPEGRELNHPGAVEQMALNEARAIIGDDARSGRIALTHRIDVETEAGQLVYSLRFVDAVSILWPEDDPAKD